MAGRGKDKRGAQAPGDRQQALLEFVVAQSSVIFYIADLDGETPVRFISSNVEAITGHKPEDFLADSNFGYGHIHPDDLPGYRANIEILKKRGSLTHEYRFRTATGEYLWFRDELRVIGSSDEDAEFVGAMLNITTEREAEERERKADEMVRRIFEVLPLPVSLIRPSDRRILFENPAMQQMMRDEPGKVPQFAGVNDVSPEQRAAYEKQLEQHGRVDNFEIEFRRADGTVFTAAISGRVIDFLGEPAIVTAYVDLSARKAREEELRLARETLHDALEALDVGLSVYDGQDRLVMINSQHKKFHGDLAEILVPGAYWPDVARKSAEAGLYLDAVKNVETWLDVQIRNRGKAKGEEFPTSDGRWYEYSHMATRQGGFVSIWHDITERKEMEENLRESEAMVRRVLEACPLPLRMWDRDTGLVLYESPLSRALFGRDSRINNPDELFSAYVHREDRDRYLKRLNAEGAVDNMEMLLRRADGSHFWAAVSATLIDLQGRATVVSTVVDLSDYKVMEQTLRDREEQFRSMVEGHPLPVWMVDLETSEILYESPSAAAMVGREWPSDETVHSVNHFAEPAERDALNEKLRQGDGVYDVEVRLKKTDGSEFWAAVSDRLVTYGEREVTITSFTDLTSRREAEAEMERQRNLMHQSEKLSALGELLAGVSHELNNPLSVLVGQAMMLKDTAPDEKTAERAERIERAADRCARIVKTFLSMARREPGKFAPLDINEAVENALDVTGYSLRTTGIEIVRHLGEDLPKVVCDADQIMQVFTNLILNAEHALQNVDTRRRLRVSTSYRKDTDQVVVKFKDTGPGIPDEIRSRIFEPLYTTKQTGSGTGLGLALCHRIVEAHGGIIELEPDTGTGASFAIRLNCERGRKATAIDSAGDSDEAARLRIILIDDEIEVGQILADILLLDGHDVETVSSAHEALQKIERRDYDIVVSDVRMPGMDGPAFYAALQETKPDQIPGLAFMTGDTLSARVSDFLSTAGRPYLEKPITPNDIRGLVARLMRAKTEARKGK